MNAKDRYILRINKIIKGVIWKVNERFRDDVRGELYLFALEKMDIFKHKSNDYVFIAMRNKCVIVSRSLRRYERIMNSLNNEVFYDIGETDSADIECKLQLIDKMIADEIFGEKMIRLILLTDRFIRDGIKYPVKEAQAIMKMKNDKLYKMLKRIRKKFRRYLYGETTQGSREKMCSM